jgi:hypothetical protein
MNTELSLNILKIDEFGRTLNWVTRHTLLARLRKDQLVLSDFAKATAL